MTIVSNVSSVSIFTSQNEGVSQIISMVYDNNDDSNDTLFLLEGRGSANTDRNGAKAWCF